MKKNLVYLTPLLIALLFALPGCDRKQSVPVSESSALVGRWVFEDTDKVGYEVVELVQDATKRARESQKKQLERDLIKDMELLKDGTGITDGRAVTWKVENGRIYFFHDTKAQSHGYKISEDMLTIIRDDGYQITYMSKAAKDYIKANYDTLLLEAVAAHEAAFTSAIQSVIRKEYLPMSRQSILPDMDHASRYLNLILTRSSEKDSVTDQYKIRDVHVIYEIEMNNIYFGYGSSNRPKAGEINSKKIVGRENIKKIMEDNLKFLRSDRSFSIIADAELPFQHINEMIQVCREAGYGRAYLVTREDSDSKSENRTGSFSNPEGQLRSYKVSDFRFSLPILIPQQAGRVELVDLRNDEPHLPPPPPPHPPPEWAVGGIIKPANQRVVLDINHDNTLAMNNIPLNLRDIVERVAPLVKQQPLSQGGMDRGAILNVDRDVPYKQVILVMDQLRLASERVKKMTRDERIWPEGFDGGDTQVILELKKRPGE